MHHIPSRIRREREQRLLAEADRCVKCGLCLPHCPTYRLAEDEGESPRGRIALMQGMAAGALRASDGLARHLQSCLACRACETVCPSRVRYGRLLDLGRARLRAARPAGPLARLARGLVARAPVRGGPWVRLATHLIARGGTTRMVRRLAAGGPRGRRGWRRWMGYLPEVRPPRAWSAYYPPRGPERGRVALFLGCVARVLDREVLEAGLEVLTHLGYGVHVPAAQGCCGAMHIHAGALEEGARLARANLEAFAALPVEAVITTASGCGAMLRDYPELRGTALEASEVPDEWAARVTDISTFLTRAAWPEVPGPLPLRVAVHEPCTLRNGLREAAGVYALLDRIPGMVVRELAGNARCCGAAGTHMLTYPAIADPLGEAKLIAWEAARAERLVTSNVGCALHLAALGRGASGAAPAVVHPVVLLAEAFGLRAS